MKFKLQWLALVALLAVGISSYIGCATMAMTEVAYNDRGTTSKTHVLTDEIIAIGKADSSLAKELDRNDCIAFIGKKNTYMLYSGGEELWRIAQLKLAADRIDTDASESEELFLDGNRVWGKLTMRYDGGEAISPEERSVLLKAGFIADNSPAAFKYHKTINIDGVVYPAIKFPPGQMPKLKKHRVIKFYANKYSGPSVIGKIVKTPLIVVGVAMDVLLLPVYIIAIASSN